MQEIGAPDIAGDRRARPPMHDTAGWNGRIGEEGGMLLMPLLMLLPLIALPIFWLLPLVWALPIYLFFCLISAAMMRIMMKTMKLPPASGTEYLVGREAKVVSKSSSGYGASYQVRLHGELWSAQSDDNLQPGEKVIIEAVRGNSLVVKRKDGGWAA